MVKRTNTGSRLSTMFLSKMLRARQKCGERRSRSMGLPAARGQEGGCLGLRPRGWVSWPVVCGQEGGCLGLRRVGVLVCEEGGCLGLCGLRPRGWVSWPEEGGCLGPRPRGWVSWPVVRGQEGGCLGLRRVGVLVWVSWSVLVCGQEGGCLGLCAAKKVGVLLRGPTTRPTN